jgi:LmbE family N-acetylglucosaminyl deacetylase
MLQLTPDCDANAPLRVLCLGAHSDDLEIGCAGLILKLLRRYPKPAVRWVVLGADDERRAGEARASATRLLQGAGEVEIVVKGFRDSFFPYRGGEIKDYMETLKSAPVDLILTHWRDDLHQDHRVVCELTWNTFRNHLILEYEIPKYDGDLGRPSVFVPLEEEICRRKVEAIMGAFPSQRGRSWFEERTFMALMRLRGMECNAPSGYAEAFYGRKILL